MFAKSGQWVLQFFNEKARERYRGLKHQKSVLRKGSDFLDPILIHCASFGEYEQVIPLINQIRRDKKDSDIILSFFSPSGYRQAVNSADVSAVFYLPIDVKSDMRNFIDSIDPFQVYLVKYEVWINLIEVLNSMKVPVYLLSARFYIGQPYFQWYGGIFRKALESMRIIFVQDGQSQSLLKGIGIDSIQVEDSRADRVLERYRQVNDELSEMERWSRGKRLLILGSIWPQDWAVLRAVIPEVYDHYALLIAPHEMDRQWMNRIFRESEKPEFWTRRGDQLNDETKTVILDTVGLLADSYRYGSVAYIGGAFKQGLHNILEPAVFGLPVIFGPQYSGFGEAQDLMKVNGGFSIKDESELKDLLQRLTNVETRRASGEAAKLYIDEMAGSTDRMMNELKKSWN